MLESPVVFSLEYADFENSLKRFSEELMFFLLTLN